MKYSAASLLALASLVTAQQAATDADVTLVQTQINNVIAVVSTLDNDVKSYSGPSDSTGLQAASEAVVSTLNTGTGNVNTITGVISITQASTQLLTPVNNLNSIVSSAVSDVIAQKPLLVSSCLGPTILDQLDQQLTAATTFRGAIASKFATSDQGLVNQLSQPALNSLQEAVGNYTDQTSLPASCQTASSNAVSAQSTSNIASSVVTTSAVVSTTAVTSSAITSSSTTVSSSADVSTAASTSSVFSTAFTTSSASSCTVLTKRPINSGVPNTVTTVATDYATTTIISVSTQTVTAFGGASTVTVGSPTVTSIVTSTVTKAPGKTVTKTATVTRVISSTVTISSCTGAPSQPGNPWANTPWGRWGNRGR